MSQIALAISDIRRATSLAELNVLLRISPADPRVIDAGKKRAEKLETQPKKQVIQRLCACGCGVLFTPRHYHHNQIFASRKCGCKAMRDIQAQRRELAQEVKSDD